MKRVLVTGSTGFIGTALCERLAGSGYTVRAALRTQSPAPEGAADSVVVGDIGAATDWDAALDQVDAVVHAAARTHFLHDSAASADLYTDVNVQGTAQLARAAARANVSRFVYISSVKVNGEESKRPYASTDQPAPHDLYGKSKWRGEQALLEISAGTGLQTAIVRPPLVYGPKVRANFLRLLRWVDMELPLPLGAVQNCRSLVNLWNLTDLISRLVQHPAAMGRTWMVSDGHDLSTPDLIRCIASAMKRRARLLPIPAAVLRFGGALLGRTADVSRLCGSLTVDIGDTRKQIQWEPPVSVEEGILRTVGWYRTESRTRER